MKESDPVSEKMSELAHICRDWELAITERRTPFPQLGSFIDPGEPAPGIPLSAGPKGGWEELDQWAFLNNIVYRSAMQSARYHGLGEIETLRFIIGHLLQQNESLLERIIKITRNHGFLLDPARAQRQS